MSDIGEIFDPEIHAVDKNGNPSLNKDGSFRKKRRDASKKEPAPASTEGKRAKDQRDGYARGVAGLLQIPASLLALVDPVDAYCAAELVNPWANVLADLAMDYPQLAAAIERAQVAGPVAGIIGVGLLTAAQFAHNHGKIPAHMAQMVGARPRVEIEQLLKQRGAELAAQAEAQAQADAEAQRMSDEWAARHDAERAARDTQITEEYSAEGAVEHEYADNVPV